MASPLSLRDEAIARGWRAASDAGCRRQPHTPEALDAQIDHAVALGVDAVLGVLTTRIQAMRPADHYCDCEYCGRSFADDLLAVLGVAPTTPEPPEDMPYEAWVASQGGDPGPGPGAASLPTHDQEQP